MSTPMGRDGRDVDLVQDPAGFAARRRAAQVEPSPLKRLFWWAFALRALTGLVVWVLTYYAELTLLEDAWFYEHLGYALANDFLSGHSLAWLDDLIYAGRTGWVIVVVIGIFYVLTGGIRALPLLLLVYSTITAVIPVYTYWISLELGASPKTALRAGWLVALSPVFIFWSGSLYKEGLIFLVLSLIVYHTLRLQKQWTSRSLVFLLGAMFALLGLRFYLAAIASIVVTVALVLGHRPVHQGVPSAPATTFVRQVAVAAAFVSLMVAFGFVERTERPLFETSRGFLVQLDVSRQDLANRSYSGYLAEERIESIGDAFRLLPIGLLYFLTVPHPWDFGGFRQNLTIPETLFWVVVLYSMILLGMRRGLRENRAGTAFIISLTAGMCAFYAIVASNVGITYRMRSQVWLLWVPFAAWGIEVWRERRGGERRS